MTEEGSGKEEIEEPQKSTAQAINSPLSEAPSPDLAYTLPVAQPLPEEPAPAVELKVIPSPLPILQNIRKLVATAHIFATTLKKLVAAQTWSTWTLAYLQAPLVSTASKGLRNRFWGCSVSPTFCFQFSYFILFYFDFFNFSF